MKSLIKKIARNIINIMLVFSFSVSPVLNVYAIDSETLEMYSQNNILFYDACDSGVEDEESDTEYVCLSSDGSNLTVIGDKLATNLETKMFDNFKKLEERNYDGKAGRKWSDVISRAKKMDLKDIVFFLYGGYDDEPLTQAKIDEALNIVGVDRIAVFITNYVDGKDLSTANSSLRNTAKMADNVVVIDWESEINDFPDKKFLGSKDKNYLTEAGKEQIALLVSKGLNQCAEGEEEVVEVAEEETSSSDEFGENNKDYAGRQILSDEMMAKIKENMSVYKKAADEAGIPWQMLAVLHYREHRLAVSNPENGQGIYQLASYTNGGTNENAFKPAGEVSQEEFLRQSKIAAKAIKDKESKLTKNSTGDDVKRAFFKYNGTAMAYKSQAYDLGYSKERAENGEGSPYVMNKADEKRDPDKNPTGWGQIKTDGGGIVYPANGDYGAYVVFVALNGGEIEFDGCDNYAAGGNMDVTQTAIDLAWKPGESGYGGLSANNTYSKALSAVGLSSYDNLNVKRGSSCDAFVATAYRYSGVDSNFACCGVTNIYNNYLENNSDYVHISPNTTDPSVLESGDILILNGHHVKMYIEIEGKGYEAQASYGQYAGKINNGGVILQESRGIYQIFRHV